MAIPAAAAYAIQYAPAVYSLLSGLFRGKSPQEKAVEKLEKQAREGLDDNLLNEILAQIGARRESDTSRALRRLAAGNISPSSGLAQEVAGATRRGFAGQLEDARTKFMTADQAAKDRANQALLSLPQDNSTGDIVAALMSSLASELSRKGNKLSLASFEPGASQVQPGASNIGMRLPAWQDTISPPQSQGVGMRNPFQDYFRRRAAGFVRGGY